MESFTHRGLQCFGENVRGEVSFRHITIRRAFGIFVAKGIPKIDTQHLGMVGCHSVELFDLMIKFLDMATADNIFGGRAGLAPEIINVVGLIQARLIMGMVAPRMAFVIQNYITDHIDEINNFGPRMKSMAEEHEEHARLEAATRLRFRTYAGNYTTLYRNGFSSNTFLYHVEISFLDEMEFIHLDLEPNVPSANGNRTFKGLPRLWENDAYDIVNDDCRHAFLLNLIGDEDTTLGFAYGLATNVLLSCPDRCLLIYVIYKMSTIKSHKKAGQANTYFVIKKGRYGGHTTHRNSNVLVAIDIMHAFWWRLA
jgi:hypothetical protein